MAGVRVVVLALTMVGAGLAGCIQGDGPGLGGNVAPAGLLDVTLPAPREGGSAALTLLEAQDASGNTLWLATAGLDGHATLPLGPEVARVLAWRGGEAWVVGRDGSLTPLEGDHLPPLSLVPRVDFPNPVFPVQLGTTCLEKTDGDLGCGLDEPSIAVDGRGWIYYTAACCFLVSSPVFVSKDQGATFQALAHPLKDFYGNEGDLAIDDAGNLYYMDIDLATFGIARWNPDLSPAYGYRRPGEPLVDRPWIRAGQGGVVHAIYNTGSDTIYYRSTDYALTFELTPSARYGSALAGAFSDVRRDIVGMFGGGQYMMSTDAGLTWGDRTDVGGCADSDAGGYNDMGAAVDEAGTVWFHKGACVTGLRPDGTWTRDSWGFAPGIALSFSWMGAGAPGAVGIAGYGRVEDPAQAAALGLDPEAWYLFVSSSTDLDSEAPHWATLLADPEPLAVGDFGRRLGDFMNVAVGPEGGVHVAYARNAEMDDSATATYIGTTPWPGLAPSQALVGPFESNTGTLRPTLRMALEKSQVSPQHIVV